MTYYETEQERFWAGDFGTRYILRNQGRKAIAANIALFAHIFKRVSPLSSLIEFGANIGLNLIAIRTLFPHIELSAVEINQNAVNELRKNDDILVYPGSALDFNVDKKSDMVLTKGFLIHINPNKLERVYDVIYNTAKKYICIAEYYNPKPTSIEYRGYKEKLFKRDFAGEILDKYKDVSLIDYGFVYHRDKVFPQDDITWFLLEKI